MLPKKGWSQTSLRKGALFYKFPIAKRVFKNVKHCSKFCSVSGGYVIKQNSILFVKQNACHIMEQRAFHFTKIKIPSALPREFLISVMLGS
jgi:hypothetical protein